MRDVCVVPDGLPVVQPDDPGKYAAFLFEAAMSEWAEPAVIACSCGGETRIVNTRGREGRDVVYRQRQCKSCGSQFSTFESAVNPRDRGRVDAALSRIEQAVTDLQNLKAVIK